MYSDMQGRIVTAKAGRDIGRCFVVLAADVEGFVLMADGDTRRMGHPKRKKLMHLEFRPERLELAELPEDGARADAYIRKALKGLGYNNKTVSEEG